MKTALTRAVTVALLLAPLSAFAAYNDVTLTTSAVINVGGVELDVTGSSASIESITVNASNFTVSLQSGSSFAVSAPSFNQINVSVNNSNINNTVVCTASASSVTISTSVSDIITITPSASTCPVSTSSSSSSSGGNGAPVSSSGGGGSVAYTAPAIIPSQATQIGTSAQSTQTVKFIALTKPLSKGSTDVSVKILQQMLNQDKDTQVSLSGAGASGKETTFFGNATLTAIKKFQVKWGIVKVGNAGYGTLGPKTRAKLNTLFAQ